MLEKLKNHQNPSYFFLYAVTFFTYGTHITGLGPLIPYLSKDTGIIETDYSFLFTCRSFSMFVGTFLLKHLQHKKVSNHTILTIGCFLIGLFSCFFSLTRSSWWLGIWMLVISLGYSFLEVIVNVCLLMTSDRNDLEFWMLISHGIFGLGGLTGPYLIYIF